MHVFGRWEEAREPGENPRMHVENMQTPHRENQSGIEPGTHCCEETLLPTTSLCSPAVRFILNENKPHL